MTVDVAEVIVWQALLAVGCVLSLLAALVLVFALPESDRFLASKGLQPQRVAALLRRLTGEAIPQDAEFVVADEYREFQPALLFRDQLRLITPLLWLRRPFRAALHCRHLLPERLPQ